MVLRWPGVVQPGTVCDARVQNVDFVPTILDIAGMTPPAEMRLDGASLAPAAHRRRENASRRPVLRVRLRRAVLAGKWKYIALRYPQRLLDAMTSGALTEAPTTSTSGYRGRW
jgi:arylsulfatase A-like enzyme